MLHIQSLKIDLLRFHDLNADRYPFLLESVACGSGQASYDILFACPQASLRLTSDGQLHGMPSIQNEGFLSSFGEWFKKESVKNKIPADLPFSGGWFMFLAYELVREIESNLDLPDDDNIKTVAYAVRCPAAIIVNHSNNTTSLMVEDEYADKMPDLLADFEMLAANKQQETVSAVEILELKEEPGEQYCQAVRKIRDYIIEGDVFQVNLSRKWQIKIKQDASASQLYKNLRINNPSPFSGLACLPEATVISSSPERLVSVRNKQIESRPIAGTRPRSDDEGEDERLSAELLAHPKEQAEHIMLIDLERNDLGRVCVPGSIQVNELMTLESYAHVHHIVSNVKGILRDDITPADVIRAVFPGGTITGCPKVRCMEIIAELEQSPRGAYTGSMGYINLDGSMDLNILIRTLVRQGKAISLRAGAGIVFDSDPERELNETRDKARGLLKALSVKDV